MIAVELAVPLAFLLLTLLLSPWLSAFQIDPDEGINAMKSLLVGRGGRLYSEIWNDQPPLMTLALAALWRLTGESVTAARVMVLLFSSALLWACARIARRLWGRPEAVVAPLVVLALPIFQRLSVAVMIGLPALSLATLALVCVLEWHARRRAWLPLVSGVLLGLSLMTKLFTALLVPIILAGIVLSSRRRGEGSARPAALWCLGILLVVVPCLLLAVGREGATQLLAPHLAAAAHPRYHGAAAYGPLRLLLRIWPLLPLALAGAALALWGRCWRALYLIAWAAAALAVTAMERPVWNHHQPLYAIPVALLATAALTGLWRLATRAAVLRSRAARGAVLVAVGAWAAWLVASGGGWFRRVADPVEDDALVALVRDHAAAGDLILTDLPMVAFRAGVSVPPETAVFSDKRLSVGGLTEESLIAIVERRRPALVLLGRFKLPALSRSLESGYRSLPAPRAGRLLLRADLDPGRRAR